MCREYKQHITFPMLLKRLFKEYQHTTAANKWKNDWRYIIYKIQASLAVAFLLFVLMAQVQLCISTPIYFLLQMSVSQDKFSSSCSYLSLPQKLESYVKGVVISTMVFILLQHIQLSLGGFFFEIWDQNSLELFLQQGSRHMLVLWWVPRCDIHTRAL